MSTYPLRLELIKIARRDVGKVEESKNRAPWIEKLWPATTYPAGYNLNDSESKGRSPYCAAGVAYCLREWLKIPTVLTALGLTSKTAEHWRCKSAGAFRWKEWAIDKSLTILPKNCILKTGDIVIYDYSHIELVVDDNGTTNGPFVAIGYNTNSSGSRDGEGCFEKPRARTRVECFIRILN